jgi:hypothetical protein
MADPSVRLVVALALAAAAVALLALPVRTDDGQRREAGAPGRAALGGLSDDSAGRAAPVEPSTQPHAHTQAPGVPPGMTEHQLREFESAVLGPEHAREHAMQRRAQREAATQGVEPSSPAASAAAAGPPAEVGRWGAAFQIPVMAIHGAVLPTGKVMWFSYPKNPSTLHNPDGANVPNTAQAWLWDPATGTSTRVDPPLWRDPKDGVMKPANIWCAGQTFTADGRLVVVGGNLAFSTSTSNFKGLQKVYTFNPFAETWTEQPDMRHGRWYPSAVRLPDGRIPILSGWDESGKNPPVYDKDVEVFTPSADLNGRGSISLIGQTGLAGMPPTGGLYPHMFAMPSGRTLVAGPFPEDSWFMNSPGATSFSWTDVPNPARDRLWGTAVLMPGGPGGSSRVMGLGGSAPPTITSTTTDLAVRTTEVLDEANSDPRWQPASSMNVGRGHHNTVLLPDGSMVTVGGGVGIRNGDQWQGDEAQKQIELWDPATRNWRLGPSQAEKRTYHSIAMLLPDGRVISAGDDVNGGIDKDTAEIYEPPYLFKGARPTISWAPGAIRTGTTFEVDTPDANIARATLLAPSAVTHAADMNQRSIELSVSRRSGGVTLSAPATAAIAPPGYYMLFLLNDSGVPSVARWVRLSVDGTPSALPEQQRRAAVPGPGPSPTTPNPVYALSRAVGSRLARKALAKELGRFFRSHRALRQRCSRSKAPVVSCSVSWVFPKIRAAGKPPRRYRGVVKVTRTGAKTYRYYLKVERRLAGQRRALITRRGRLRA